VLALVDCNNFFVSCERVFNPSIIDKPVIVLSSNDGCVIARSNESKALKIPMGIAFFKITDLVARHKVHVFSSNFALYTDMSSRVMKLLREFSKTVDVYSVDEAFLKCPDSSNLEDFARSIRKRIKQCLGIPVSVGIASTKTLAKVAVEQAKISLGNICVLQDHKQIDQVLKSLSVNDIWGIGANIAYKLKLEGIFTAHDFKNCDPRLIRKKISVVGEKTLRELQGIVCFELNELSSPQKSMQVSKSLNVEVTTLSCVKEIIASHISSLAEKLRRENLYCTKLSIYIASNRFKENYYIEFAEKILSNPTNLTDELLKVALPLTESIFKEVIKYKKLGVMGSNLVSALSKQGNLLGEVTTHSVIGASLCKAIDTINKRFGKKSVYFAACGVKPSWSTNSLKRSPCYTTSWSQLKTVF
jgi:DNA polymerase V